MKTGECYFRVENGDLWLSESFVDENGAVSTVQNFIELAEVAENDN